MKQILKKPPFMAALALICLSGFAPLRAEATVGTTVELEGVVRSFDEKIVRVRVGDTVWEVPREKFFDPTIETKKTIRVHLKRAELETLKHEPAKK